MSNRVRQGGMYGTRENDGKWGRVEIETAMGGWEGGNENHLQTRKMCVNLSVSDRIGWQKGEKGLLNEREISGGPVVWFLLSSKPLFLPQ